MDGYCWLAFASLTTCQSSLSQHGITTASMAIWHLGTDTQGPPQCMGGHPNAFDQDMFGSEMCTPGLQGGNIGVTPFISILRKLLTNMEMNMCSNCGQVSVLCIGFCSSYTVSCTVNYMFVTLFVTLLITCLHACYRPFSRYACCHRVHLRVHGRTPADGESSLEKGIGGHFAVKLCCLPVSPAL